MIQGVSDMSLIRCKLNFDEDASSGEDMSPIREKRELSFSPSEKRDMSLSPKQKRDRPMTTSPTDKQPTTTIVSEKTDDVEMETPPPKSFKGYILTPSPQTQNSTSPTEERIRCLKLCDSPNSPKTLLLSSKIENPLIQKPDGKAPKATHSSPPKPQLQIGSTPLPPKAIKTPYEERYVRNSIRRSLNRASVKSRLFSAQSSSNGSNSSGGGTRTIKQGNFHYISFNVQDSETEKPNLRANVNPFTPNSVRMSGKKRARKHRKARYYESLNNSLLTNNNVPSSKNSNYSDTSLMDSHMHDSMEDTPYPLSDSYDDSDGEDAEEANPCKRIAMHEVNVSRYNTEFAELNIVGKGAFGSAYLCRHRLDGCLYAIKRSLKPVSGSTNERRAMNEVYAHAVLGAHKHVVRYYSAWAEDDHMIIQNEYCNGGSLARLYATNKKFNKTLTENQTKELCRHVAKGLKFIHSLKLAHMDIKPDNIFISCMDGNMSMEETPNGLDSGSFLDDPNTTYTYKIGDLGHVTSMKDPTIEEGDSRYMARELLLEDSCSLEKVDIFALGLTLFEGASGFELQRNGEQWHKLRDGKLPDIPGISPEFKNLIQQMVHPEPSRRPTAEDILNHKVITDEEAVKQCANKTKKELGIELVKAQQMNNILEKKLENATYLIEKFRNYESNKMLDIPIPFPVLNNNTVPQGAILSSIMNSSPKPYNTRSQKQQEKLTVNNNSDLVTNSNNKESSRLVGRKSVRSQSTF